MLVPGIEMKFIKENMSEAYALSKFIINGILGVLASYFGWGSVFPFPALVLLFPFGGVAVCFFLFYYVLDFKEKTPIKMLLLSGTFSSWAFFFVIWILFHSVG